MSFRYFLKLILYRPNVCGNWPNITKHENAVFYNTALALPKWETVGTFPFRDTVYARKT